MQNAAFAARGLDWAYLPLPVAERELADAVRGLVALEPGQTLVALPYPETATAGAARAAGATVVNGLEVLVAQGAASFELWTGVAAPIEVMRAAVGLQPSC